MNPLSLIIIKSTLGYVLIFILIILVAAVIGFVTARLFSKSIYTPIIKGLEDEKLVLDKQIEGLEDNVVNLNSEIDMLNDKVKKLEKEIAKKAKK